MRRLISVVLPTPDGAEQAVRLAGKDFPDLLNTLSGYSLLRLIIPAPISEERILSDQLRECLLATRSVLVKSTSGSI